MGAGQRLVEMVVGVDQPRQYDMARSIEALDHRQRRIGPGRNQLDDHPVLNHDPTPGILGEDGERISDPDAHDRFYQRFSALGIG
jgi:hypothetical protein